MKFEGCPHCKNTMGFAFGTCIECGYNDIDSTFHFIKVSSDDFDLLSDSTVQLLTRKHSRSTFRER